MIIDRDITVRPAKSADAFAVSQLISAALRETNSLDYSPAVIDQMGKTYGPARIAAMIGHREMFVAERDGDILGVIGYAVGTVRSLFVDPKCQRQGIGQALIIEVERLARKVGIRSLTVAASLTATGFYLTCGFSPLRPVEPSGIAMTLMHKWLTESKADEIDF